jgi:hypothetical protein
MWRALNCLGRLRLSVGHVHSSRLWVFSHAKWSEALAAHERRGRRGQTGAASTAAGGFLAARERGDGDQANDPAVMADRRGAPGLGPTRADRDGRCVACHGPATAETADDKRADEQGHDDRDRDRQVAAALACPRIVEYAERSAHRLPAHRHGLAVASRA